MSKTKVEDEKKPLPTHVEEVEALRLYVLALEKEAAVKAANDLIEKWETQKAAMSQKYAIGPADAVDLKTGVITRAVPNG